MLFPSSARGLLAEALSWMVLAGICAASLVHFEELKSFTATALGLPPPGEAASRATSGDGVAAPHPAPANRGGGVVELRAEASGHIHTDAEINGRPIGVMVDTGATLVALSYEDAERAGIYLRPQDFTHTVSTANGRAKVAPVTLERVSIGDITVRNVKAVVSEEGRLNTSLLGMSFLKRLSSFEFRSGTLYLKD